MSLGVMVVFCGNALEAFKVDVAAETEVPPTDWASG